MKGSRFGEERIIEVLREHEAGAGSRRVLPAARDLLTRLCVIYGRLPAKVPVLA